MVSVILPVYNEEGIISHCLESLSKQKYGSFEIIVVDDGSSDNSAKKIKEQISKIKEIRVKFFKQKHKGPGAARNLGVSYSAGNIVVFVDSDMIFEPDFLEDLVKPIENGQTPGTFSKEEYLQNRKDIWAICWNINRFLVNGWKMNEEMYQRMLPSYYPDKQPVFRAIRRSVFEKVGGFSNTGYTDDWTLSRKLGFMATSVKGAKYYHRNPQHLLEAFRQARWIGKNEFISGSTFRRLFNLIRYSLPVSFILSFYVIIKTGRPEFIFFKTVYDLGIWSSIILP